MALVNTEIKTYFGRCRCCLNYGYLKNMWEEHEWQGDKEIYVEMLLKCFALSWEQSNDSMEHDQICEACIIRLRDANQFKKTILESQEELLNQVEEDCELPVKIENTDYCIKTDSDGDGDGETKTEPTATTSVYIDDPDDPDYEDPDDPNQMEYEDVEYLDDEDNKEAGTSQQTERRTRTPTQDSPKTKWPRRLPKSERYKTYKQYTQEDLRKCVEAVRNQEMTAQDAAEKYNIPKKTILGKARLDPKEEEALPLNEKAANKEKMYELIQELKTILTYTNATPYKSKALKYYCAYCSTDGPAFEDPDELRTHTRTQHVVDRTQKIEYALRPHWMNETVKLDIDNLLCNVCCTPISSWNDMFKHLKEKHKIILDQTYTRVIPYALKAELKCALCKEDFSNYMNLDGHMNAHYNNYVCDDCGDTFLAENRLKQHIKIHSIGKFPCEICSKTFSLEKYKKKHVELVHKQLNKFKCLHCDERFMGEYVRHLHTLEHHKDKVKIITCEFCAQTFTWRPYYATHKKKKHEANSKKFDCKECGKKFYLQYELKEHLLSHTGEKHFPCKLCSKRYVSSGSLKHHMYWHKKHDAVAASS